MQRANLTHHGLINTQATSRVDNQHIKMMTAGVINRITGDLLGLLRNVRGNPFDADLLSNRFKLFNRSGTIDVGTDHGDFLFTRLASVLYMVALGEPPCKLAGRSGFARTLQTGHQNNRGRLHGQ